MSLCAARAPAPHGHFRHTAGAGRQVPAAVTWKLARRTIPVYLHRSNRLENLAGGFAALTSKAPLGPFESEVIVVQGKGMERWLGMQLARAHGVWAQARFRSPASCSRRRSTRRPAPRSRPGASVRSVMTWALADLIGARQGEAALAPLARYLAAGDSDRLVQLAERVARTFDRYVVHRPRLIADWEAGRDGDVPPDQRWQPVLWRDLVERFGRAHLGARFEAGLAALAAAKGSLPGLPARVSVFGVSSLPPIYVRAFDALSRRIQVHMFVLCPSRHYWADLRKRRDVIRDAAAAGLTLEDTLARVAVESPSRLLGSLGRVGAELQLVLEELRVP